MKFKIVSEYNIITSTFTDMKMFLTRYLEGEVIIPHIELESGTYSHLFVDETFTINGVIRNDWKKGNDK